MKNEISKDKLKKLNEAFSKFQEAFNETFSIKKTEWKDIKTFEDACEELSITAESVINSNDTLDEAAYKKLKIISRAINQGWFPDWDNLTQKKWWPYFYLSSGFGFSYTHYSCAYTDAIVGSRLCFETEEKATFAGKQFLDIYKMFLK
jgi:hypothetical protein